MIAGDQQPPVVHALAHAINQLWEISVRPSTYTEPLEANPVNEMESLRELAIDMSAGNVDLLFMLGGNPAYDAPADLGFRPAC